MTEPQAATERSSGNSFSVSMLDGAMHVRLVSPRNEGGESIHSFMRRMFDTADSVSSRRIVIDLRGVRGSDARLLVPLIRGIVSRERFSRPGGLYVVIGDRSFSPAQNAATLLSRYAQPVFVSDPRGT